MSNNHQQTNSNRKTPKQRYQESISATDTLGESKVPTGTIHYAVATLAFCILFNILYATGFISFVQDGFDIVFSTIGILLPVTAIFQLMIQLGGSKSV